MWEDPSCGAAGQALAGGVRGPGHAPLPVLRRGGEGRRKQHVSRGLARRGQVRDVSTGRVRRAQPVLGAVRGKLKTFCVKLIHVSGLRDDDDHLSARLSSSGAADPEHASPTRPMASETSRDLAPLVKRADEIQAHHPLMAYYCACPSSRATKHRVNNRTTRVASLPSAAPSNPRARRTAERQSHPLATRLRPHARGRARHGRLPLRASPETARESRRKARADQSRGRRRRGRGRL